MSPSSESNGRPNTPDGGLGVLSNLPRTRPQRSSARRAAARKAEAGTTPAEVKPKAPSAKGKAKGSAARTVEAAPRSSAAPTKKRAKPKAKARTKASSSSAAATTTRVPLVRTAKSSRPDKPRETSARKPPRRPASPIDESVPRQGFESEMDRASGPVQPPGGAELVATAAEIVTELARAGVSTGERLLKDLLGRLPLS
jgi:hypothetical protein